MGGTLNLESLTGSWESIVGDGGLDFNRGGFSAGGPTGGNIAVRASSVNIDARDGGNQARITNRGTGTVFGDIDVTTSGQSRA